MWVLFEWKDKNIDIGENNNKEVVNKENNSDSQTHEWQWEGNYKIK